MAIDPITGALIGGAVAGGVGGLFGKKAKAPNYSALFGQLDQSGARQREIIMGVRPQTTAMNQDYGNKVTSLTDALKADSSRLGRTYLRDVSSASNALGTNLSASLASRVNRETPELQRQLRESLASTGGLGRGAAGAAMTRLAVNQANQIGEGNRDIATQELAAKQRALDTVFNADQETLFKATGLNYDTLQKLFYAGRQDLIDEAAQLVDEERSRTQAKVGLMGGQINTAFAQDVANTSRQNDLISALLSGLGQAAGYQWAKK